VIIINHAPPIEKSRQLPSQWNASEVW
jgi:hypothetical protein